ncbi:hypothetical protein IAU60_006825 [Kwoniella sp. DSM 27419]
MTAFLTVPTPRLFSNKENTPSLYTSGSPSPSSTSTSTNPSTFELTDIDAISTSLQSSLSGIRPSSKKTQGQGLGLGRAPKLTHRKHAAKPYHRVGSIQRAKRAANRSASGSGSRAGAASQPAGAKRSARARPPGGEAAAVKLSHGPPSKPLGRDTTPIKPACGVKDRVRLDQWRRSVWRPAREIHGQVKVPLMLPYPRFPPVPAIPTSELRDVPIPYILQRLAPLLPSISTITLSHRPYATVPHPHHHLLDIPQGSTLALAIPEVVDGSKPHWAIKARGREPDMVLAIGWKGAGNASGAAPASGCEASSKMAVPIMSLVFATQCAYWPALVSPDVSEPAAVATPSTPAHESLATIDESDEVQGASSPLPPASSASSSSWSTADSSSSNSSSNSSSSAARHTLHPPTHDALGFLHVPVVPLLLPSPETFNLIHRHLHHPRRPLLPDLLDLPEHCTSRSAVLDALREAPVQDLMNRLASLQGFWQNLCALGVGRASTWRQLGEAWACVLGVIAGHGMLLRGVQAPAGEAMDVDAGEAKMPGHGRRRLTAAEEVAWEWLRAERDGGENVP